MSESTQNDDVLELDAVQVAARWSGMFLATFFLAAVFAPRDGLAGSYMMGGVVVWAASFGLAVYACLFRSRRRYRQAMLSGWMAPVLPFVILATAYSNQ